MDYPYRPICGIWSATAHADSLLDYTISFTVTHIENGMAPFPPTGSFVFDAMTNKFTSFTVDWNMAALDFEFDLTACANGGGEPPNPNSVCMLTSDGLTTYKALTNGNGNWRAFSFFSCSATECAPPTRVIGLAGIGEYLLNSEEGNDTLTKSGTFTVVAPELSNFGLTPLGIGFALVCSGDTEALAHDFQRVT